MSSNSILSSPESEKRWVLTMEKMFPQLNIDFDTPCVFKVSKILTQQKPEAYAPPHLGLGPYHHLRPHLFKMQGEKLAAIKNYLSPEKFHDFRIVVAAMIPLEPFIRSSYDQYLDLDIETLAWMLAIDGVYLLQFLKNYSEGENLAGDVMMLENQIPLFLIKKIQQCVELYPSDVAEIDESSLFGVFENFLRDQSPLEWNPSVMGVEYMCQDHLLQCLYNLIVFKGHVKPQPRIAMEDVEKGIEFLAERGLPGASTAGKILSFLNKFPWKKIKGVFKKGEGEEQTPLVRKIDIPSVSKMSKAAGIKFIITQGIWSIKFEESKLHLPVIRITPTSEVVLRNLVAYEEASSRTGVLAEYLDLMCGIIDCANDVKILKEEKIIISKLGDEEIVRIFNGISKSTRKSENKLKSNVEKAIDDVNMRYNNLSSVKVKAFFEKSVFGLFKALGVLITIVVLILLVLQAFCSVFGCSRWFNKSPSENQSILLSYQ